MAEKLPFDEDVMTLIMGLGGPEESGQHGRTQTQMPEQTTVDFITQIRDLCDEFLTKIDKGEEKPAEEKEAAPEGEEETPEEE